MKNDKFYVDIIKWTIIVLIAALAFYFVCPKYDFQKLGGGGALFINKITGELYLYYAQYGSAFKVDVDWTTLEQFQKEHKEEILQKEKKSEEALRRFEEQLEDANKRSKSKYEQFKELLKRENNFGEEDSIVE